MGSCHVLTATVPFVCQAGAAGVPLADDKRCGPSFLVLGPSLFHYARVGVLFFPKDLSLLWFSKPEPREKLRKSPSNDLLRLTVREPGPDKPEPDRNDRTVLQKLRTGPQVSPNTSPDEPARAHLDSCGRRAGASSPATAAQQSPVKLR